MSGQVPLFTEIGDPESRHDEDFYRTPKWQTWALLTRIPVLRNGWTYFEPCAGDGAIVRELESCGVACVRSNDIVTRGDLVPDFLLDARQHRSWARFFCDGGPEDVVITNPPFNDAFEIAATALNYIDVGLALLLRLSWLEPTDERADWLAEHPPTRVIVLPRYDYRQNGKTDSVTSAWMLWDVNGAFCRPGIEVVSKTERDQLVARYGDR
jgi:hypothetical protein